MIAIHDIKLLLCIVDYFAVMSIIDTIIILS